MESVGIIVEPEQKAIADMLTCDLPGVSVAVHVLPSRQDMSERSLEESIFNVAAEARRWIILATGIAVYEDIVPKLIPMMEGRLLIVVSNNDRAVLSLRFLVAGAGIKWIVFRPGESHRTGSLRAIVYRRDTNLTLLESKALERRLLGGLPGIRIEVRDDVE